MQLNTCHINWLLQSSGVLDKGLHGLLAVLDFEDFTHPIVEHNNITAVINSTVVLKSIHDGEVKIRQ